MDPNLETIFHSRDACLFVRNTVFNASSIDPGQKRSLIWVYTVDHGPFYWGGRHKLNGSCVKLMF